MARTQEKTDSRRFRQITTGRSVHDVVDRCREAVVEFIHGTGTGWSSVDLELWLGAPYRAATSAFAPSARAIRTTCTPFGGRSSAAAFEASLLEAGNLLVEMLVSCAAAGRPAFVTDALDSGFVVGVKDSNGVTGYVPVYGPEMHLVDRVASLLAADFLTRPNDYSSVSICDDCGAVSFAWTSCHHEICRVPLASEVVRRDGSPVSCAAIFPPSGG